MKRFATIFLTTAASVLVLATACSKPATEVQVSGVELDRETLALTVGNDGDPTATLTATVAPAGATNKDVTWSSSDLTVATVDANGKVTAVAEGEAEITVTTRDGGKEDSCTVTVDDKTDIHDPIGLLDPKYIPDAGFLKYCEGQMAAWDTNEDGALSTEEAAAVKTMSIADIGAVRSLRGIEHFTGLETLELRNLNNNLAVLDLTKNTALRRLVCEGGSLTTLNVSGCAALESLDVSGCPALRELYCFSNRLASLDVSKCPALTSLDVAGNRLTALDVSQNRRLQALYCNNNTLTSASLKVSGCTALETLDVAGNNLTALDLSNNPALTTLKCSNNRFISLDVSNCTALKSLSCDGNGLTALDVSKCAALTYIDCHGNRLPSLDISNCIRLDNLDCYNNLLAALDVSRNTALTILSCGANLLTTLDLVDNRRLELFSCGGNRLSELTVEAEEYGDLKSFDCQNNDLSAAALDAVFGSLPDTGPEGPTYLIYISGNPGAGTCDASIAAAKNWTVVKDFLRRR